MFLSICILILFLFWCLLRRVCLVVFFFLVCFCFFDVVCRVAILCGVRRLCSIFLARVKFVFVVLVVSF